MKDEIIIDGVEYVRKKTVELDNVVLVRTLSAGVFYGEQISGQEKLEKGIIELSNARRVWYWAGAASLSQLAIEGTSKPSECKFPLAVPSIILLGVLEVIPCTKAAVESLNSVKVWKI